MIDRRMLNEYLGGGEATEPFLAFGASATWTTGLQKDHVKCSLSNAGAQLAECKRACNA